MDSPRIGTLVTEELLSALDHMFPQTLPRRTDSERDIFIVVGHRQVIDKLRQEFNDRFEQDDE